MKKYNVVINNESLIIEDNDNLTVKYNVPFLLWIIAYILQNICENLQSGVERKTFQDNIEEFVFSINNCDYGHEVVIPDELLNVVEVIKYYLAEETDLEVEVYGKKIQINDHELRNMMSDIVDEYASEYLLKICASKIQVEVGDDLGEVFKDIFLGYLQDLGNEVVIDTNEKSDKVFEVFYDKKRLFDKNIDKQKIEVIDVCETIDKGIAFSIKYSEEVEMEKYMYFPFWNTGDQIILSIVCEKNKCFLKGEHRLSGIVSLLEI